MAYQGTCSPPEGVEPHDARRFGPEGSGTAGYSYTKRLTKKNSASTRQFKASHTSARKTKKKRKKKKKAKGFTWYIKNIDGISVLPVGKNKDMPISDVDSGYLVWLVLEVTMADNLREQIEFVLNARRLQSKCSKDTKATDRTTASYGYMTCVACGEITESNRQRCRLCGSEMKVACQGE